MTNGASRDDALPGESDRLRRELGERDRVIAELSDSRDELAQLIETTNTGYVILDEQGRVLAANAEYVRLTGHRELAQILGRRVTEWTAERDRERNAREVRRCLEQGTVRDLIVDYVDQAGRVTPVEINASLRRAAGGSTILTICRDATARRRAEEALALSVRQYRTTIDSMDEMIHVVDLDLRIVLMNRPGVEWIVELGLTDNPLGRTIFELFPFLSERVRDEYRVVFETAEPLITQEQSSVGTQRFVTETRKIPIVEHGSVALVVTVVRDITAAVQAQEQLRQVEKMEALGQLAGGIAHDFNNHLAIMLGCADLLQNRLEDPDLLEYVRSISRSAVRSSELTQQLLAFSRKAPRATGRVDLHELVAELAVLLARTLGERIEVRHRFDASFALVDGDAGQIQNALLNLAINARDAMPDGGRLLFATENLPRPESAPPGAGAGTWLRLVVSDTGVGMNEETRRRVFEPFYTTKPAGRGTGMGLASVYATVARHHGTIRVTSAPGSGSAFTIDLPVLDPD